MTYTKKLQSYKKIFLNQLLIMNLQPSGNGDLLDGIQVIPCRLKLNHYA
jgi:hypothetical protein